MTAAKTPYALNGVSECLKMGLASAGVGVTVRDQLSGLREACRKKQQHEGVQLQQLERELAAETADDAKAGQEACSGSSGDTEVARESSLSEASGIEDGPKLHQLSRDKYLILQYIDTFSILYQRRIKNTI
jgi:EREBP-like factor